ncbi:MAG: hypothetical protein MZV70_42540 [Desulfobacterales bacterium]|nr:hypothetical protein [Desulfobacterales bacterium]
MQGTYVLVGVKVLPPATSGTFKPTSTGTLVDLEWKFTEPERRHRQQRRCAASGHRLTGPGGYSKTYSAGAGCVGHERAAPASATRPPRTSGMSTGSRRTRRSARILRRRDEPEDRPDDSRRPGLATPSSSSNRSVFARD